MLCRLAGRVLHAILAVRRHSANHVTVADLFTKTAARYPNKIAVIFEDQRWTFKELDEYANKVGNHFRAVGLLCCVEFQCSGSVDFGVIKPSVVFVD